MHGGATQSLPVSVQCCHICKHMMNVYTAVCGHLSPQATPTNLLAQVSVMLSKSVLSMDPL